LTIVARATSWDDSGTRAASITRSAIAGWGSQLGTLASFNVSTGVGELDILGLDGLATVVFALDIVNSHIGQASEVRT